MSEDLQRASMNVVRVCVFHMNSKVASKQPSLMHECYGVMLALSSRTSGTMAQNLKANIPLFNSAREW